MGSSDRGTPQAAPASPAAWALDWARRSSSRLNRARSSISNGSPPSGRRTKNILESSDEEYAEYVKNGFKNAPLREDEAKKARDFEKEMAAVQQSLLASYTKIADDVLPTLTTALQGFSDFLNRVSQVPGGSEALAVTEDGADGA